MINLVISAKTASYYIKNTQNRSYLTKLHKYNSLHYIFTVILPSLVSICCYMNIKACRFYALQKTHTQIIKLDLQ